MHIDVIDDMSANVAKMLAQAGNKAELALAIQVKKDSERFVPMLTGSLKNRTRVIKNTIVYPGPYARYLYYGKVMVDPVTGRGPYRFKDEYGNIYFRYRRGARLVPSERDLEYTKDFHREAGPFWFERAKSRYLQTWLQVAKAAATK